MKDTGIYSGDFNCRADVEREYNVAIAKNIRIVYAGYWYRDYSGNSVVLFKQGRKLYEVRGGHCSCDGLGGQWEPEEVNKDQMMHMLENGAYYDNCKDEIMKVMGWDRPKTKSTKG